MTPCVYHYIPAANATDWRLIKIPIFWDHVIILLYHNCHAAQLAGNFEVRTC